MSSQKQTVLAIGGTGAQGVPVVQELTRDGKYNVHVLTRSTKSAPALELASLPGVTIFSGDGYDEANLHSAFSAGIDIAFVNTNGFAIGEKAEIYWGIRIFEIAAEHGVKHFVWANLESSYKVSGYQPRFRTGHFDGKQKVADWISAQPKDGQMKWSILTSCMYLEMFSELLRPSPEIIDGEEVMIFKAPVGKGRPPMIFLEDLGRYGRWLIDHPEKSAGLNLKISTEQVGWDDVVKGFTEVTGKKAIFKDITLDEYFASGAFPFPDTKVGHSLGHDDETLQTYRENFTGFWNTWKESVLLRDYAVLDEILPTRVKSVKEWMQISGYTGKHGNVLKDYSDATSKHRAV
ncbi:related to nitrogen metabolic regulation protein nmr [Phialocephala subalpina]|uniref:Related to nitrogen metabolic regulation protein nmr n=1 Tax=Phialocephala subalpina TaxID=576137 RepID=A0A1L7XBC2_9HELO|nr:related to nitrogen metabolic regulation protein nmr [Phialocephala subalpina]